MKMNLERQILEAFSHRKIPLKVHKNEKNALTRLRAAEKYENLTEIEFNTFLLNFNKFDWIMSGLLDHEFDALYFKNRDWRGLTCTEFDEYSNAAYGFMPAANCYYLAGVMSASIRERITVKKTPLAPAKIISTLVFSLDSMLFDYSVKDTRLIEKFILLTPSECTAVQEWLLWVAKEENDPDTYMKAYGNLEWLIREYDSPAFKKLRATAQAESSADV